LIFVCLGTKRFSFNRLLKEIDTLIYEGKIEDDVFAQIGQTTYTPKHFRYNRFLSAEEYDAKVNNADLVITHGGTGAIIKALKANKQIIAVPRLKKYDEHLDDHQLQIVGFFTEQGYVRRVDELENLYDVINKAKKKPIKKSFKGSGNIIKIIDEFIELH